MSMTVKAANSDYMKDLCEEKLENIVEALVYVRKAQKLKRHPYESSKLGVKEINMSCYK